jgi:hypothetical protein
MYVKDLECGFIAVISSEFDRQRRQSSARLEMIEPQARN